MKTAISPTIRFDIFIAGDIAVAKQTCRQYCLEVGLCVTVEPVIFIYTGGEETGLRVGLINYPRFPTNHEDLELTAHALAGRLLNALCQHSFSIVGPHETFWYSAREQ